MSALYGYTGRILRINLTKLDVGYVDTIKYVPAYIGGRGVCTRIFWEEVAPCTKALSPENKLIFMTGPTTGTGIPTGGRTVLAGVAPQCDPEQFSWSSIGGWFGAELKFAGYDGFILEGRAQKPTYIWIKNDKVEFLSAKEIWGLYTYDVQLRLQEFHGHEVKSLVIGPAGENLLRNAIIATSNENAAGKGGFGAVFGSKNLKAITVFGTGSVTPAHVDNVLELRRHMGQPQWKKNPIEECGVFVGRPHIKVPVEGGMRQAHVSCSHGCNQHCNLILLNTKSITRKNGNMNQVTKCVGVYAYKFMEDSGWTPAQTFVTEKNNNQACLMLSGANVQPDMSDPAAPSLYKRHYGDTYNFWDGNYERGAILNEMCNQYGLNKWEIIIWLMTWLAMGTKEDVFKGIDFGMEIDVSSVEFMRYMLDMIVYRKGYYGNLFAEGMSRAIRALGKEKFGDTIYQGRYSNQLNGKRLDIPISFESAWGYSYHWNGRGFQGANDIATWLPIALMLMTSTRDAQSNGHHHDTFDYWKEVTPAPERNPRVVTSAIMNENAAELKDSLTSCDWQLPDIYWDDIETEIYYTATGYKLTREEIQTAAERMKNLFRAITIRNYGRTRQMEISEVYPCLRWPDSKGRTVSREDFEALVTEYYKQRGWDERTGWPTRATYERCGLKDVADELEAIGKLP